MRKPIFRDCKIRLRGYDILPAMGLQVAAWILMSWLLAAAWLSSPAYAYWAMLVVFLWWTAWYNRNPPWPHPALRGLVYLFFISSAVSFAFFSDRWQIYLVLFEIVALWIGEMLIRRRKTIQNY